MELKRYLSTTILAAGLAMTPVLASQAAAQAQAPAQVEGSEIAMEEGKIDAFIVAALAVAETREAYIAQLEGVTDEEQQMAIVQEADAAILEAVENTPDISVDEYIAIGEAATVDPELAAQIDARFAETAGQE
ncbi:DUF4168 domain-containing protein [Roseinatronobacter bogoriensis]|uniref:DUF4168 domain-containing protein n=1 Tax=Roseinatronobacter bogoriensis subsp. barguzinensis TaxID=441209 RepID=A0A2K8KA26_9RHOB|nr:MULTISPECIES: DUF4168 domain-containing protein [Rhodobaca]ATX66297.1 DUF4168 domain-containing protein [Rhodobaca barguzinensis]MBB4207422.1 hypothetical protein [Rhodobaca bogoriensis DSM 18756]TDW40272.1 uncharacterized protein DUF4168 [Rhodobaca barguzinensis]TDY70577.1 uncharacterized protein DUF4168 [Rhodobaca bogoriensis DSM 18756]